MPDQQYVDQAYMSGKQIDNSAKRGIDLRGRVAPHSSTKAEGFRLCDFDLDVEQQQARCPLDKTSVRRISEAVRAHRLVHNRYRGLAKTQLQALCFQ